MEVHKMFADRLKTARKAKGYTLESLANEYNAKFNGGLNKGTLSKYENGKQEPMSGVVGNLAKILDVTTDYLLGNAEVPNISDSFTEENLKVAARLGKIMNQADNKEKFARIMKENFGEDLLDDEE